ncbi:thiamine phosphate synthase [Tistrella mobilis]|uniref:Thiamine-phosphate synthase n=1 Tax=Tistrella mobilis (strain KA081020-065) TaxID=1110502 RepID=I3TQH7_TISMK|nr:thiamine phosphate synthase [Tistrella mobilis]AFK55015.1 thiamine-phosphate pyrophosphorylase [Tistrella mobilis KA081020-065]
MKRFDLSLYLVLDPDLCRARSMVETTRAAVAGGATIVQLRDKAAGTAGLIETGRALMSVLDGTGVPLIVNDDVDAAVAIGAHGLHVGQGDMPAAEARRRVGPGMILGLSVETEAAVRAVDPSVVDYVGAGPVFATQTKPDHEPPTGFDGLARLVALSPVPAVAIGGLKAEHVAPVLASGAKGLAVVSAICGQPDPEAAARLIADAIRDCRRG